jgi:hypothetical protein
MNGRGERGALEGNRRRKAHTAAAVSDDVRSPVWREEGGGRGERAGLQMPEAAHVRRMMQ